MLTHEKIQFYLKTFKTLTLTDLFKLFRIAKRRKLQAGEVYIKEGSINKHVAYITKGLVRTYSFKKNGDEVTLQLYWEDQFFGSRHSIILNQPSPFIFEAVEPTTLLEADYDALMKVIDSYPQFAEGKNYFFNGMLSQAMERAADFMLLTAEERYMKLLNEKSDIVNRVPDKYIATMLGITPVSLSRIRRRLATRH
jgi:CRP-like cAMP-binding protein